MNLQLTDDHLRRIERLVRRAGGIAGYWLEVFVIAAIVFLACEIIPAFFHGGAVDRVLGGGN